MLHGEIEQTTGKQTRTYCLNDNDDDGDGDSGCFGVCAIACARRDSQLESLPLLLKSVHNSSAGDEANNHN